MFKGGASITNSLLLYIFTSNTCAGVHVCGCVWAERGVDGCLEGKSGPFDIYSMVNLRGIARAGCQTGLYLEEPVVVPCSGESGSQSIRKLSLQGPYCTALFIPVMLSDLKRDSNPR